MLSELSWNSCREMGSLLGIVLQVVVLKLIGEWITKTYSVPLITEWPVEQYHRFSAWYLSYSTVFMVWNRSAFFVWTASRNWSLSLFVQQLIFQNSIMLRFGWFFDQDFPDNSIYSLLKVPKLSFILICNDKVYRREQHAVEEGALSTIFFHYCTKPTMGWSFFSPVFSAYPKHARIRLLSKSHCIR